MVIGDDEFETQFLRDLRFRYAGNPAIDADNERNTHSREFAQLLGIQAIALREPQRRMELDMGAHLVQERQQNGGASDAIDVVVAVNAYPALFDDGSRDSLGGSRDARQLKRLMQAIQRCIQESAAPRRAL